MDGAADSFTASLYEIPMRDGFGELELCTTANQVGRLMNRTAGMGSAYNFENYMPLPDHQAPPFWKPTIEFRQAAASLNGEWITRWAYICVRIVELSCREIDWDFVEQLLIRSQSVMDGEESLDEPLALFLRKLGCGPLLAYITSTTYGQRANADGPTIDPRPPSPLTLSLSAAQ
jgi:hypothetical protein